MSRLSIEWDDLQTMIDKKDTSLLRKYLSLFGAEDMIKEGEVIDLLFETYFEQIKQDEEAMIIDDDEKIKEANGKEKEKEQETNKQLIWLVSTCKDHIIMLESELQKRVVVFNDQVEANKNNNNKSRMLFFAGLSLVWYIRMLVNQPVNQMPFWEIKQDSYLKLDELIANYEKKVDFSDSFKFRIECDIIGSFLPLGGKNIYSRIASCPVHTITNKVALSSVGDITGVKTNLKYCDGMASSFDYRRSHMDPGVLEQYRLWVFAYMYQMGSKHKTDFIAKYYVPWHEWGNPEYHRLLSHQRTRNEQSRRPVICHVGHSAWIIHDFKKDSVYLCNSSIQAIYVWLLLLITEYNREDEFFNVVHQDFLSIF